MEERRRYKRVSFFTEVEWGVYGAKFEGKISDLSVGGAYIDTLSPCPEGSEITMRFQLPNGKQLMLKGVVKTSFAGMGMGIEFINLTDADRKALEEFIRDYY
jgi:c-di-GMP-binding flagellar brake protein YcgR